MTIVKNGMAKSNNAPVHLGVLIVGMLALVGSAERVMSAGSEVDCEAEFARLMKDVGAYPDLASRTMRLEALSPQCKGTGIYEARLSYFYMEAGRYREAREAIEGGLTSKAGHEKELRLALANVEFRQGRLSESEQQAMALISDFPDWSGGYTALGETRLVQHRFDEGIDNLERANSLEPASGAYVLLAMAYYQVERPRDSARAMQQALRLDIAALKHTQAVCATAYSLLALGHPSEAEDLLVKHLKVQPKAADDPTYKAAVAAVGSELQHREKP